jgi:hypothetical protein
MKQRVMGDYATAFRISRRSRSVVPPHMPPRAMPMPRLSLKTTVGV